MRRVVVGVTAVCAAAVCAVMTMAAGIVPASAATDDGLPTIRRQPSWLPPDLGRDSTVVLAPGTTDFDPIRAHDIVGGSAPAGADQYGRTVGLGFFDPYRPNVEIVDYPEAFGFTVAGRPVGIVGHDAYNTSVDEGTATGLADAQRAWIAQGRKGTIVLSGYSQGSAVAMNIAYLLHQRYAAGIPGAIPDSNVVVVTGADTRFPDTGAENVFPSVLPGAYTNGPRDPAATGSTRVISYCIKGDLVCDMANPIADPLGWAFYLAPGATIHGKFGDQVNKFPVERTWSSGNTTYVVLDGGNPWGMWLRKEGVPLPANFDETLDRLIPVPEPGQPSTDAAGNRVPTPREVQQSLSARLRWDVPVTDPDARAAQRRAHPAPTVQPRIGLTRPADRRRQPPRLPTPAELAALFASLGRPAH